VASPGRSFLSLLGLAAGLAAYSLCGFVTFIVLPLVVGAAPGHGSALCLVPAALLGSVLAAVAWRTSRSLWTHLAESRALARTIEAAAIPHPHRLHAAAATTGMRERVDLIDEQASLSFVHGMLTPRIAISRGFLDLLSDRELRAALEHERYHVRHRDPMRSAIAAALSDGFFLLPYLGVLRARYETGRELAADISAERACGRRALLGALAKALEDSHPEQAVSSPSLAAPALLEARVRRLETGRSPRRSRLDARALAESLYGLAALTALFALALLGLGGTEMLQRAVSTEVEAIAGTLRLACLLPLATIPALALWPRVAG
jgi:Zn-dependent protease with chaperone function